MNFEEALNYELQAISGLENKVFPQNATENEEPPFVVYFSSEGERIQTLDGYTDLTELSFEVQVVGRTYDEMKAYTKVVIDKIVSFYGRSIGVEGPNIKSVSYMEPTEDQDNDTHFNSSSITARVRY